MSQHYDQRTQPLKALYDKIRSICGRHVAISMVDTGDFNDFGGDDYTYPMVYIETINQINENDKKNGETYVIGLNICDRMPTVVTVDGIIQTHDRLKQIFSEIKSYIQLNTEFGTENVGPASLTFFDRVENDNVARLRGDFTIEVDMLRTPTPDLLQIFRPE